MTEVGVWSQGSPSPRGLEDRDDTHTGGGGKRAERAHVGLQFVHVFREFCTRVS